MKIHFEGSATELVEQLKLFSNEEFFANRVTRELVQNGYTLKKYGVDFQYRRVHGGRKIILHYDRERDSSDSKINAAVTVTESSQSP